MDNLELICFQMISNAGMAKSTFVEAMQEAEAGNFDAAQAKIEEGKNFLVTGHGVHAGLIQKEAAGEKTDLTLLLMHAEDQLLSCETLGSWLSVTSARQSVWLPWKPLLPSSRKTLPVTGGCSRLQ